MSEKSSANCLLPEYTVAFEQVPQNVLKKPFTEICGKFPGEGATFNPRSEMVGRLAAPPRLTRSRVHVKWKAFVAFGENEYVSPRTADCTASIVPARVVSKALLSLKASGLSAPT